MIAPGVQFDVLTRFIPVLEPVLIEMMMAIKSLLIEFGNGFLHSQGGGAAKGSPGLLLGVLVDLIFVILW